MKTYRILSILFIALLGQSCEESTQQSTIQLEAKTPYTDSVNAFRSKNDLELRVEKDSPLMKEKRADFIGLNYYPVDKNWKVHAQYTRIDSGQTLNMPTTTERVIEMAKAGKISFSVNGKIHTLFAYNYIAYPDEDLFVPFLDQTNGDVTYGGGRYLDVEKSKGDSIWIDFNMAYNPYCAYNHSYSCPIPPLENNLNIEIPAGEKVLYTY